jgi:fructoselysine-6-P-deglycase FrlB-like protein
MTNLGSFFQEKPYRVVGFTGRGSSSAAIYATTPLAD